jgi:(1->4)-alpha-D-glucan 1-alpha-D-glucosylmutase
MSVPILAARCNEALSIPHFAGALTLEAATWTATYRLQLSASFRFGDVEAIAPYLAGLGVSHVYLSPILTAMPGSTHGYDGIDPTRISHELGGEEAFVRMATALRRHGVGLIADIVPNHLAASPLNPWWSDVLQHGRDSRFARYFDIRWQDGEPIRLPVLGSDIPTALARGDLRLDATGDGTVLRFFDASYPLAPGSLCDTVDQLNSDPTKLTALLERQHYRLVPWREAQLKIDYRRFFNIDGLVGVRVEDPVVFEAMHERIIKLVDEGLVQGLRVDHIDGLRQPYAYLRRLREAVPEARIVVEKILEEGEMVPDAWPIEGTTGYEFLSTVNGLFIKPEAEAPFTSLYGELTGEEGKYEYVLEESKRLAVDTLFGGDLSHLAEKFEVLQPAGRWARERVETALREVIVALPVYRTYFDPEHGESSEKDRELMRKALELARSRSDDHGIIEQLQRILLEPSTEQEAGFVLAFQQYTGPAMAKGGEDTTLYRYNRFIALNEVGANPGRWSTSVEAFHALCTRNAQRSPATMLTLSTHDTKRGADVRLRIAALTEIPDEWSAMVRSWMTRHEALREHGPDANDAYLLYQTLVGAWPIDEGRAREYMLKAVREAKRHTTWTEPDEVYEGALGTFIQHVLADEGFAEECGHLALQLAAIGNRSSLAQTLLLLAAPGIPDIYQGSELWDVNLVDPDNRRPVDFDLRRHLLEGAAALRAPEVIARADEGLPKLWLIAKTLNRRRDEPELFEGAYIPLYFEGPGAGHLIAFQRNDRLIAIAPRLTGGYDRALSDATLTLPVGRWRDLYTATLLEGGRHTASALLSEFPVALLIKDED